MNFSLDAGHNASPDIGASGIRQEDVLTKELVQLLDTKLKSLGHTITDCTPYGQTFNTVGQSLQYRCNKANTSSSSFHLCVHFNCGGGHGVEAYFTTARDISTKLCNEISALGFTNRGIKDGNSLYVVRNTNMPCVLLEVAFVDSVDDMNNYNANNVANAIVKALTGQTFIAPKPTQPYVISNYIPQGDYGIILEALKTKYFNDIERVYIRSDVKGLWIETQYLTQEKAQEIATRLKTDNLLCEIKGGL